MASYTQGDTRITLSQADVLAGQNNGSLVIDSQRSRCKSRAARKRPSNQ